MAEEASLESVLHLAHKYENIGALDKSIELLARHEHECRRPLYDWVIYTLAIQVEKVGDLDRFRKYSDIFLRSTRIDEPSYRTGRLTLLRKRIQNRMKGVDLAAEADLLMKLSGTERDTEIIRQVGVASDSAILTIGPDQEITVAGKYANDLGDVIAIGSPHYMPTLAKKRKPISPKIQVLNNVEYIAWNGECGLYRDGYFFEQLNVSKSLADARERARTVLISPVQLTGTALIMSDYFGGENYCHWIVDWVSRAFVVHKHAGPFDWICARVSGRRIQTETLENLPFLAQARLLRDENLRWYRFDRAISAMNKAVDSTHPAFWGDKQAVIGLREALLSYARAENEPRVRNVYISRADAGGRREVINEAELIASLQPMGFEIVTLSGKSVREQVQLFASARIVVGAHGAGLTNILFMKPESAVVELLHYRYGTPAFYRLACTLELRYAYLSCSSSRDSTVPELPERHSNSFNAASLYVDVDRLSKFVRSLI
jgi:hypothetical protein